MAECKPYNGTMCHDINLTTCSPLPYDPFGNESQVSQEDLDTLYDEEGCFFTHVLRKTNRYETYMKFSLCMGILTIGRYPYSLTSVCKDIDNIMYDKVIDNIYSFSVWKFRTCWKCCQYHCSL